MSKVLKRSRLASGRFGYRCPGVIGQRKPWVGPRQSRRIQECDQSGFTPTEGRLRYQDFVKDTCQAGLRHAVQQSLAQHVHGHRPFSETTL
jgi:hypothetical protein